MFYDGLIRTTKNGFTLWQGDKCIMSGSDVQGWLENGSKLLNYTVTFHPVALAACVFWSSGLKELLLRLRSSQVKKWLCVWSNLNLWPVRSDHRCDVNSARWQHHSGYVSRYSVWTFYPVNWCQDRLSKMLLQKDVTVSLQSSPRRHRQFYFNRFFFSNLPCEQ